VRAGIAHVKFTDWTPSQSGTYSPAEITYSDRHHEPALRLASWLSDDRDHFLRIGLERVTGKRLF
jgi:hypothetical protein